MKNWSQNNKILRFIYQHLILRFIGEVREPYFIRIDNIFNHHESVVPNETLGSVILFEDVYKISYEVLFTPFTVLLIYLLKVKEKVDIYDELSNLNPFKINTNYKVSANKFNENYIKSKGEKR